ncbi:MAG: hypothetical protein UU40_C0001G0041 [Candidatus Uhrbacteria bacterium GW2011_GWD2_41_121]|uniref:Uncharacterized protein n=1 Tax=Candidatus Uhrbacteria bacterium GW2011_GWC1_41_20 TaxID=1618983 RepID=A0A0G0VK25_9BACT|nr:MAG: hypothetical protein UT52_C0001G0029 [Candidatus Uhrbacteria bacterium GW2011_GWE1_39_46]KKR64418.1 MAG: hypothetical protein UU04_C0002G0029 [Candidatus Uhrbacteria bacterium GW2011_GWC2_40_450]KKR89761.1 MAG: hypothetical protein UU36_C0018G0004 [Candidatus Uhrbacteria bacterium GW2011_GWE2_41_1153]KKR90703.1 MAG: hypothetical protein UU40_C0001G0041 [Candidatus Uhrbacteria bacterium GW2011_GWD2_41_121]KKR96580.1 MAG: hypothetical protein UU46_C0001G0029 [Candidatus Uhrbacteria bacter
MSTLPQASPAIQELDQQANDALRIVVGVILHLAKSLAIFSGDVHVRQIVRDTVPYLVITCHRQDKGRIIGKGRKHIRMMNITANQVYRHYGGDQINVILPAEGTRYPLAVTQPDDRFPVVEYRPRPYPVCRSCA